MKKLFALVAILASAALPVGATPQSPDYINGGQCAGDVMSKCRYSLDIVNHNEPMVVVPGLEILGQSRISTVLFCAKEAGVDDYRDLQTDSEFDIMEACMIENT